MATEQTLWMKINDEDIELKIKPKDMLVDILRDKLGLKGTKKGCEEGECGACTVLLNGKPVNSCLIPAMKANGKEVVTIEGLSKTDELHPIQKAFVEAGAIQCGFCSPGVILSAKSLLDNTPLPSEEDIKNGLAGNLCRCTGYVKFIAAVKLAAQRLEGNYE